MWVRRAWVGEQDMSERIFCIHCGYAIRQAVGDEPRTDDGWIHNLTQRPDCLPSQATPPHPDEWTA